MIERIDIIGLGPSVNLWRPGEHYSIGVNDCWKYGKTDRLIVVNPFDKEPHRKKYIDNADPADGLWSHLNCWESHKCFRRLAMRSYFGRVEPETIYKASASSTFVAMSMAATLGATTIVLYGVDFVEHSVIKDSTLAVEIHKYKLFAETISMKGKNVYLSSAYGALKGILPSLA